MMTNYEYTRIDAENKALKKRIEKLENSIEQMIIEIAQIDDRNGWIPIDEVFDIILKYQKGGKE